MPAAHLPVRAIIEDYLARLVRCRVCRMPDTWLRTPAAGGGGPADRVTHVECMVCGNVDEVVAFTGHGCGDRTPPGAAGVPAAGLSRERPLLVAADG